MSGAISDLSARMILDSRGNPTVEVDCYVNGVLRGRAAVPSGASTGSYEAVELRDDGPYWSGKGVSLAISHVNSEIRDTLIGMEVSDQEGIDTALVALDATANKSRLGANAILGVSMACLRAASGGPLWVHIAADGPISLPVPQMNILNGGAHAASNVDVQEFMVVPHGFDNLPEALRAGVEIYHALKALLNEEGLLGGVGDEGGFAPNLPRNEDGLRYVLGAIEQAGYTPGNQVSIALDCAAQEFCHEDGYHIDGKVLSGSELGALYSSWLDNYPIVSLEDAFGEDDWNSWIEFTAREGHRVQIVGLRGSRRQLRHAMLRQRALHERRDIIATEADRRQAVGHVQPLHKLDDAVGQNLPGVAIGDPGDVCTQRGSSGKVHAMQ